MLILPHGRRFLGVNSVTNSDPGKGFLPVPIIRNEYWFEKFYSFPSRPSVRPLLSKSCKTRQRPGENHQTRKISLFLSIVAMQHDASVPHQAKRPTFTF
ncbi:hypothetical protein F7234_15155 [Pseudomonas putida]|nr:hypothetical protein F7234_15155 [Pseudomonas putida]